MLNRIEQIVKIFGFIVGISAVWVAWCVHQNDIQQEKINKSFELFHIYQSGEVLRARSELDTLITDLADTKDRSDKPLTLPELTMLMIKTLSKGQHLNNYNFMVDFYDTVYKCIELGACDKKTSISLFAEKAKDRLIFLLPVLVSRFESDSTHGLGLQCLATRYEAKDCKSSQRLD